MKTATKNETTEAATPELTVVETPTKRQLAARKAAATRAKNKADKEKAAKQADKQAKREAKKEKKAKSKNSASDKPANPLCEKARSIALRLKPKIEAAGGKVNPFGTFSFSLNIPDWEAFLKVAPKEKAALRALRNAVQVTAEGWTLGATVVVHRNTIALWATA